jgi:hypothetical protein
MLFAKPDEELMIKISIIEISSKNPIKIYDLLNKKQSSFGANDLKE